MKVFGLTGGIGMGKSAAAQLLTEWGIPVVDTDLVARQVVQPGEPALAELAAAFGPDILGPDGQLRRERLAERIFTDVEAHQRLEAILHPRIRAAWVRQVEEWRREGRAAVAVAIPLLFETNAASHFDAIICVACSERSQTERLAARGWSQEQIAQRCRAQWPIEKKMALSDYVVWSEGGKELLADQLRRIVAK